jgi:hypothetical protein
LTRFQTNLKPYVRQEGIVAWDDTYIQGGDDWQAEINKALSLARVAVLLVSSDFVASDFIAREELPYILEQAKSEAVKIVPVAVRPSAWAVTPLRAKQFVNNPDNPLSTLAEPDRERELVRICKLVSSYLAERPRLISEEEMAHHSRSAEVGLTALYEAMDNPDVLSSVATSDAIFAAVTGQIKLLVYYKNLHDFLHTLQFQCYNYLLNLIRAAKKDPNDITVWDDVVNHELEFDAILQRLKERTRDSQQRQTMPWIDKLALDLEKLFDAVQENNTEKIDSAIKPVRRVLATEPSRINDKLAVAAEALQLSMLIDALKRVSSSLARASVRQSTLEKFEQGIGSLEQLHSGLNGLIDSHNEWQQIDGILRRIEGSLPTDLSDLQESWEDLRDSVVAQYAMSNDQWARLLGDATKKLDTVLEGSDPDVVRSSFMKFKTRASHRFYQTDLSLKELCDQLGRVAEPLGNVLGRIKNF